MNLKTECESGSGSYLHFEIKRKGVGKKKEIKRKGGTIKPNTR